MKRHDNITDRSDNIKIAAMTMVRNDDIFLKRWVEYYGANIGPANLYIYFDGKDQTVPEFCHGTNVTVIDRQTGNVVATDRKRAGLLSDEAARLMNDRGYSIVLGTDVDEFLVVDPDLNVSLHEFLSRLDRGNTAYSGLGVDVGQVIDLEGDIDPNRPMLAQRSRGWLYSRYTKATVLTRPARWGSGFHRIKGHNYHIARGLYLFHLGGIDLGRIRRRVADPDSVGQGWSRHLTKRARTILAVSRCRIRPWQPTVDRVRLIQTLCRPLFAWNKPTTFGRKFIVEIPERFKHLVKPLI